MVIELRLAFTDEYAPEEEREPVEFVHTLSAPEGMEVTGGQIFVENADPDNAHLQRFSFRIDRLEDGTAQFVILEDVPA